VQQTKNFVFHVFLFDSDPPKFPTFTVEELRNWKRINEKSPLVIHEGESCSSHYVVMQKWDSLKNSSIHIYKLMNKQSTEQALQNRLRLKASIESVM